MIYQIRSKNRSHRKQFLILGITVLVLTIVNIFPSVRTISLGILSPIFDAGSHLNRVFRVLGGNFADEAGVMAQNERLQDELAKLKLSLIDYKILQNENNQLRQSLSLTPGSDFFAIKIVARPPQTPADTLILGAGKDFGLVRDSLIFASEGVLVGRVVELSQDRAIMRFSSFPDTVINGYLLRTQEFLEVRGSGGGSLESVVPIDFDIKVNDEIVMEDTEDAVFAIVRSVETYEAAGFKRVLFSLPLNMNHNHILFAKRITTE